MTASIATENLQYLRNVKSVRRTPKGLLLDVDAEQVRFDVLRDHIIELEKEAEAERH